ncbi:MAG: metallophosphoesterase [Archaeoglobi archaeon]|nr:metallophosphoesterase [Candidatus Mnemosynella sp.]
MRIAHISDLHISSKDFVEKCGENLPRLLDSLNPELVIVTGDLTDQGFMHEYERAEEFLNEIKAEKLIVPGNHDSRNSGDTLFEDFFGTRFPVYESKDLIVLGIDSSEPDIDDGHVGRENYSKVIEIGELEKIRVVAMHHHLIPIPGTGRERNIPVDSGDFLRICTESEIHLILSGHKHIPWIWRLENSHFITAGTATTRRLKGKSTQSFNVLDIEDGRILLRELRTLDGGLIEERRLI